MTLSDAAITKWELPDLFSNKSLKGRGATPTAATPSASVTEFDAGREAGFEQGKREGLLAAQKELDGKRQALDAVMESLATPLAQIDNQISRELIQLSIRLAEIIVHREVDLQPELIERQVTEALGTLSSSPTDIGIRLHPEDAKILEERRGLGKESIETEHSHYRIIPDTSLNRGGCILKTPTTIVNATIEKQLQDLLEEMLENASKSDET